MIARAIARYIRVSPRKTRKVIDLIRGLPAVKAEAVLDNVARRPTIYIKRLLRSAIDSADKKLNLSPADLYISLIKADQGPTLKRHRAMSMGRAGMIRHRTTHITLELERINVPEKKKAIKTEKQKKTKVIKQKTENRKQRTDNRGQKRESKRQKNLTSVVCLL